MKTGPQSKRLTEPRRRITNNDNSITSEFVGEGDEEKHPLERGVNSPKKTSELGVLFNQSVGFSFSQ
ncbi:hypothetical protein A4A49_34566 [Nicotiana attenuata]|uniref:Uncharacterized protein n=1 Tax=Nicotiana attenuata TaxID=49451 RepID=A0A1J6K9H9_NICAT|nr:hypothetical protein A4A49_34566 [Nicotiana attenuata]